MRDLEPIECENCGGFLGWAAGDLNCCVFFCCRDCCLEFEVEINNYQKADIEQFWDRGIWDGVSID